MELGSLLALALTLLVAAFVARPLLERFGETAEAVEATDALIAQREAALTELRDLDFDHATGKVGDDDYTEQRARLVAKGATVLRQLAERKDAPATEPEDEIEQLITVRRATRRKKPAPTICPHCAARITPDDRFCAKCGTKLRAAREAA